MIYFLLLLGFALLIKGAGWLVDGATAIASRFGVSELIIGLTICLHGHLDARINRECYCQS
jgi:cation:H+ antiporter